MAESPAESTIMHYQLVNDLGKKLAASSPQFKADFLTAVKPFLDDGDIFENKDSVQQLLSVLHTRGRLPIAGDYKDLITILRVAGLTEILKFVQERAAAIKLQKEAEQKDVMRNAPAAPADIPDGDASYIS